MAGSHAERGALRRVHEALARLRTMESRDQLIAAATHDVCHLLGFDRAVMFRVSGSELVGVSVHIPADPGWAAELLAETDRVHLPLRHMLFETEMLRQRRGMLLTDAQNDPRGFAPLVQAFRTRAYVACPIMPAGRVIGFLHADRHYDEREVDEHDLDALCAYTEGFGFAFERTSLRDRIRRQREHAQRLMESSAGVMDELSRAEVHLGGEEEQDAVGLPPLGTVTDTGGATNPRLASLLTRRELEVLQLMADGATNQAIATRLVITEGTVKSHVGHVLRKLRAANRAEAVSRYLRLAAAPDRV